MMIGIIHTGSSVVTVVRVHHRPTILFFKAYFTLTILHYLTNMLPISLYYLSMFLSFMYAFVILH